MWNYTYNSFYYLYYLIVSYIFTMSTRLLNAIWLSVRSTQLVYPTSYTSHTSSRILRISRLVYEVYSVLRFRNLIAPLRFAIRLEPIIFVLVTLNFAKLKICWDFCKNHYCNKSGTDNFTVITSFFTNFIKS